MKQVVENVMESPVYKAWMAWCLLAVCFFSILTYSYFVSKAIFRTFATKQLAVEVSEISERLNSLESEYLALGNKVTLSRAQTLGLTEVSNKRFISRQSLNKVLSLRDEL